MPIALNAYEQLATQMLELYEEAEDEMLRKLSRRLARGADEPGWTERKTAQTQQTRKQLEQTVDRLAKARKGMTEPWIYSAYKSSAESCAADAKQAASALGTLDLHPQSARVLALLNDLNERLEAADRAILRQANDAYADVIGHASALAATGTITVREAVQRETKALADKGILSFTDARGRHWQMDTYAEMATLTALQRASLYGYTDAMREHGADLAVISSHVGACPICAAWQGVVISVSGSTRGYPSLSDAENAGVFHPRCLHHISIYYPGITHGQVRTSPRAVTQPTAEYTARSRQRAMERQVRKYKREQAAATDAVKEREARAYVEKWQREIRRHIAEYNAATDAQRDMLLRASGREGGKVLLSDKAKKLPALHVYPKGKVLTRKAYERR